MAKKGSFAKDAVLLTASKIIGKVLVLVSAMLLARIRTLEENGIYFELLLIINLASAIFMMGLPNSINYFLARAESKEDKNRFLSLYYTLTAILSVALGIVLVALMPVWIKYFNEPQLAHFAFFLLVFPWTRVVLASVENMLIVLGKSKTLLWFRVSNSFFLLLIIFFIWIADSTFMTYMVLYVFVEGAYALAGYILATKYTGRLHWNIDKDLIKSVLVFSIPLGLASVVGTLNIEIDKLMIGYLLNTEDFAIYSNASKELPLTIVAASFTAVLMPKMVRLFKEQHNEEAVAIWRDVTTISFAIMAFFGIGMAVFSTDAMTILYSAKYASGSSVFAVYSLRLLLKCTYFGMVLNTTGKTKIVLYSAIGTLCLNTVMNIGFYYLLGVIGPALATLLSGLTMGMFQIIFSSKLINVNFSKIFPWKNIGLIMLLNAAFGRVFHFIHVNFLPNNSHAIILAGIWGIVYCLILIRPGKYYWRKLKNA